MELLVIDANLKISLRSSWINQCSALEIEDVGILFFEMWKVCQEM